MTAEFQKAIDPMMTNRQLIVTKGLLEIHKNTLKFVLQRLDKKKFCYLLRQM